MWQCRVVLSTAVGITEYPELDEIHKDHPDQFLFSLLVLELEALGTEFCLDLAESRDCI